MAASITWKHNGLKIKIVTILGIDAYLLYVLSMLILRYKEFLYRFFYYFCLETLSVHIFLVLSPFRMYMKEEWFEIQFSLKSLPNNTKMNKMLKLFTFLYIAIYIYENVPALIWFVLISLKKNDFWMQTF